MKKFIAIVALVSSCYFAGVAQAQQVTLLSQYKSVYLGPEGGLYYPKPVFNTTLSGEWDNGIHASLWMSTGYDRQRNFGKEVDPCLGYSRETVLVAVSVDTCWYVMQGKDAVNATAEVYLAGLLVLRAEGYKPVQLGGPKEGHILSIGLRNVQESKNKHLELTTEVLYKRNSGAFGYDRSDSFMAGSELRVGSEKTKAVVGAKFAQPMTIVHDGRNQVLVWEFGFSQILK